MSTVKHTPGPWSIINLDTHGRPCDPVFQFVDSCQITAPTADEIAHVKLLYTDEQGNHVDNARLIAAAPEMLRLLEQVQQSLEQDSIDEDQEEVLYYSVVQLINKIKGAKHG